MNVDELVNRFPAGDFPDPEKKAYLILLDLVSRLGDFDYLEIGSYLGGSLAPFLTSPQCKTVISIDKRGQNQADERGMKYDYRSITESDMIESLHKNNIDTSKLQCFNGDINDYQFAPDLKIKIALIDGEHTDYACFRDFVYLQNQLHEDSILVFDDSNLVFKSIRNVKTLLESQAVDFSVLRFKETRFVVFLFGSYINELKSNDLIELDLEPFFAKSEDELFKFNTYNRISLRDYVNIAGNRYFVLRIAIALKKIFNLIFKHKN